MLLNIRGIKYNTNESEMTAEVVRLDDEFATHFEVEEKVEYGGKEYTTTRIRLTTLCLCTDITTVFIPKTITKIDNGTFADCGSIKSISVDPANPVYDSRNNCNAIIETATDTLVAGCAATIIPDTVKAIGSSAFHNSYNLKSIVLPPSMSSVGEQAFSHCPLLREVHIPATLTSIGKEAFAACDNMVKITADPANPVYDSRNNCNAIIETATDTLIAGCGTTVIPDTVKEIGQGAFSSCLSLTDISLPESIVSIGTEAFARCLYLTDIFLPDSVTDIGSKAFDCCARLQKIIIPDHVVRVGDGAFADCKLLKSVMICDSVTHIGNTAFFMCESLRSVFLSESVSYIEHNTFAYCSNLSEITIPQTVNGIGDKAFGYCTKLTSITLQHTAPEEMSVHKNAFHHVDTEACTLHVPVGCVEKYRSHYVFGKFKNII